MALHGLGVPLETDALDARSDLFGVGSGPGSASLAYRLASTGKRILILERGGYLPRDEAKRSAKAVFVDGRYPAAETWTNGQGDSFGPALHCTRFVSSTASHAS
ncbi:MAG: NAD(P)-binding protein [Burkholderiaceae bacterium]